MHEPTIRLTEGETAIVGYGSLLSVPSISRTLGRDYDGPFVACRVDGWRRAWNVAMPNQAFYYEAKGARVYPARILYLNARPDPLTSMNAVLFVVRSAELRAMDHREWIYERPDVTRSLRGVRVEGGAAVMYVARPDYVAQHTRTPREAAVRTSYLRILEDGLRVVGPDFRADYERSSDPVPRELVIDDKLDPERPSPWPAGGSYLPAIQLRG